MSEHWEGDRLHRKENALWLTKTVQYRYEQYHAQLDASALCFAIDADWGAGKSFFIERWSKDLEQLEHPVIHFDAWANDLSDDPLLGFLSKLKTEIEPFLKKQSVTSAAKAQITTKARQFWTQAQKAMVPTAGVVVAGLAKKFGGIAVEDLMDAVDTGKSESSSSVFGKASEKFLELAMKSHSDKKQAISEMQTTLTALLRYLESQQLIKLPLFIFIDELDRCRPDYALKLLEGMKHLFNAGGVCFVVSTNLKQLSSAVKAVYGGEFDAYRYLKKFFSFEYMLPTPKAIWFANMLLEDSSLYFTIRNKKLESLGGLPNEPANKAEAIAMAFAYVASSMELNLRSQRQIWEQAENIVVHMDNGEPLIAIYLFFLVAVLHLGAATFDNLFDADGLSVGIPVGDERRLLPKDVAITYDLVQGRERTVNVMHVSQIVSGFHQLARTKMTSAIDMVNSSSTGSFPLSEIHRFINATQVTMKGERYTSLARYGKLVRASGYLPSEWT